MLLAPRVLGRGRKERTLLLLLLLMMLLLEEEAAGRMALTRGRAASGGAYGAAACAERCRHAWSPVREPCWMEGCSNGAHAHWWPQGLGSYICWDCVSITNG